MCVRDTSKYVGPCRPTQELNNIPSMLFSPISVPFFRRRRRRSSRVGGFGNCLLAHPLEAGGHISLSRGDSSNRFDLICLRRLMIRAITTHDCRLVMVDFTTDLMKTPNAKIDLPCIVIQIEGFNEPPERRRQKMQQIHHHQHGGTCDGRWLLVGEKCVHHADLTQVFGMLNQFVSSPAKKRGENVDEYTGHRRV